MSTLYDVKAEDLSVGKDKKDLNIWVSSDYNGNNYATIPIATLLWYLKKEGLIAAGKTKRAARSVKK